MISNGEKGATYVSGIGFKKIMPAQSKKYQMFTRSTLTK